MLVYANIGKPESCLVVRANRANVRSVQCHSTVVGWHLAWHRRVQSHHKQQTSREVVPIGHVDTHGRLHA